MERTRSLHLPSADASMLDVLQGFVHELRAAGLPVSMTENLDAMRAVEHVELSDRDTFRAVLGATLVKHHHHRRAFETVFDVYFSLFARGSRATATAARMHRSISRRAKGMKGQARRRRRRSLPGGARRACCCRR